MSKSQKGPHPCTPWRQWLLWSCLFALALWMSGVAIFARRAVNDGPTSLISTLGADNNVAVVKENHQISAGGDPLALELSPASNASLQFHCQYPHAPSDGMCMQYRQSPSTPGDVATPPSCFLSYHRVAQRACRPPPLAHNINDPLLVGVNALMGLDKAGRHHALCPCHHKHAALVSDVHLAIMISTTDGRVEKVAAFSSSLSQASSSQSSPNTPNGPPRTLPPSDWAMIDAASCRDSSMFCLTGAMAVKISGIEGQLLLDALLTTAQRSSKTDTHNDLPDVNTSSSPSSTHVPPPKSTRCSDLRRNPQAVRRNISTIVSSNSDGSSWRQEAAKVFYAWDAVMSAPGHALELITNGLGVYYRDGLDKRNVAWLVPCREDDEVGHNQRSPPESSSSSATFKTSPLSLYWTLFFLQLNEVLGLPIYPIALDELTVAMSNYTRPQQAGGRTRPLIRFQHVYFAPYYFMGWNQVCFKQTLFRHLWPGVAARRYDAQSAQGTTKANAHSAVSLRERSSARDAILFPSQPSYRIALMKPNSTTDWRAFSRSPMVDALLADHHVTQLSDSLPLVERMWHVNRAELLVTTWGSTMTTTTGLMLPRHWLQPGGDALLNGNNVTRTALQPPRHEQRLLVLIHPGYCHEAYKLFRMTTKQVCYFGRKRTRVSRLYRNRMSINNGALADFEGGDQFCVKFVLLVSLDYLQERDFTFTCSSLTS